MSNELELNKQLLNDVRQLIISARVRVAQVVNTELPMLYWHVGSRIRIDV